MFRIWHERGVVWAADEDSCEFILDKGSCRRNKSPLNQCYHLSAFQYNNLKCLKRKKSHCRNRLGKFSVLYDEPGFVNYRYVCDDKK